MHNDVHAYAVVWTYFIFVERCLYILCIYPYTTTCYGIRKASRFASSSPVSTENTSSNAVFACSSHLILKLPAVDMRCLVQHLVALLKVTSFTGWLNVWTIETDMLGEDVINHNSCCKNLRFCESTRNWWHFVKAWACWVLCGNDAS